MALFPGITIFALEVGAMGNEHNLELGGQHGWMSRRGFLAGTAAMGLTIVAPKMVTAAEANAKITLGLIGCGGRGNWIADLFKQHGGYQFTAVADYWADRAATTAKRLGVPEGRGFSGISGYKRLLDAKPDAIVIESPPFFHPEQAIAGVDAGCHVYCAKPIAVDVPGCLTIADAGRKGTQNKRCVLIDFQTRANEFYREAVKRVHDGDIGPVVSGEAVYYCGGTWGGADVLAKDPQNAENRLRAWGIDRVLSGDVITEQNIHALDVASWIINQNPLRAVGNCGKKGRQDPGTCNDNFAVVFTFPNDVLLSFAS
jgi:myo-inositol 2-dehydrogenase / D-chiro-inositol 1-dehydrogenase